MTTTHAKHTNREHGAESTPPTLQGLARAARAASRITATLPTDVKNAALETLADAIMARRAEIRGANEQDVRAAKEAGLAEAKLQRLALSEKGIEQLAAGVRQVGALPDPIGRVTLERTVPSGLHVRKVRAPLGVIAMIYEARPGVTVDAFALCFKSGNACILRGGKEAARTNVLLASLAHEALAAHGAPADALVNLSGTALGGRDTLEELLTLDQEIDLVIPRGGSELIRMVRRISRIPTIQHDRGVCHIYVDQNADLEKAVEVCATAKTSSPATCNSAECVLVHRAIADRFVPRLLERLVNDGVEVRATPLVMALAENAGQESGEQKGGGVVAAQPEDFGREFLDLTMAVRTVESLDEAIEHIATYGSDHTEAILTTDTGPGGAADEFCRRIRSSCTVVNASTRFNDGFQLGLGAEIGISTSRLHAYGPMGLEELTTQRWVVIGDGQVR